MTTNNLRERIYLIADGVPLKLDNATIKTTDSGKLLVTGWTNTIHFENVSKRRVLEELESLKMTFAELSKSFPELIDIVINNNLTIEYHMSYDDGGKAGIGICSEIEGELNWYID